MLLCTKANHKPNWQQSECTSGCTPMLGQINLQLIREFECFFTSHWRLYDKVTNYYIFWKWWNCQSHNNIVNFLEILGDTSIKYVSVLPNIKLLISSTVQNKKTKKKKLASHINCVEIFQLSHSCLKIGLACICI